MSKCCDWARFLDLIPVYTATNGLMAPKRKVLFFVAFCLSLILQGIIYLRQPAIFELSYLSGNLHQNFKESILFSKIFEVKNKNKNKN